jgi:hypothetical protein
MAIFHQLTAMGGPQPSLSPASDALGMNELAPEIVYWSGTYFTFDYCTVTVTVPLAVVLPEVPVTVTE